MKNLANCKPREFLKQTNRIKKAVENWLDVTDFSAIRARSPELIKLNPDMTPEERQDAFDENKRRVAQQTRENLSNILTEILETHPDETLEIMALVCFVEPENVDDYPISDYMQAITELVMDKAVIGFFTSLAQLGAINISSV